MQLRQFGSIALPNGVRDRSIINGKIQKLKTKALQTSDISVLATSYTNVDQVRITKLSDSYMNGKTSESDGTAILGAYSEAQFADDVSKEWTVDFGDNSSTIRLTVPKGTYADITTAQTALIGTVLIYQLAIPKTHMSNVLNPN